MKTLYRQFIVATLCILAVSIVIGFVLSNVYYMKVTKPKSDRQNVAIAQEIVHVLKEMHPVENGFESYLHSVAMLGYQIYVLGEQGEEFFFGAPFDRNSLPEEALRVLTAGDIYHGISDFPSNNFMVGHFANELKNTVGVPFSYGAKHYGLFIRPQIRWMSSDIHTVLVGFLLAVAVVNILGMIWLARQLTRPISQLTEATKQITKDNFGYPLHIERKDEIGQLSQSFHLMQKQLEHNDLARKSFISNVSHDFQSPLMNIQGYAGLLQSPVLTESQRIEYAAVIDQEANRLSSLTKQLLLLTSLDQAAYPMKFKAFSLNEQLKRVVKKYRWRLEEDDIDISYHLAPTWIRADEELLENVWENLLTNAIKYNKPGGTIEIGLTTTDTRIEVSFKDTGMGISPDAASQVFDRFFRVDQARRKQGTGLGLSIAYQIVTLHQGEIKVESKLGEGSRFIVSLPRLIHEI
jgi:signal transduction histidine kinase